MSNASLSATKSTYNHLHILVSVLEIVRMLNFKHLVFGMGASSVTLVAQVIVLAD